MNASELATLVDGLAARGLPPVNEWQPEVTRDIDMRIARNGDWFYQGSRIDRPRMVRLFSTLLRRDGDEYFLVTPQERLRIIVEDAPFTAVLLDIGVATDRGTPGEQQLVFTTNVGDHIAADARHPITVHYAHPDAEPSPYVLVRDRLTALISRPVFYQLADLAVERDGIPGVVSAGCFMPLGPPASA